MPRRKLLTRVATRIINEVKRINRVVYDVTSKPQVASMEARAAGRPEHESTLRKR